MEADGIDYHLKDTNPASFYLQGGNAAIQQSCLPPS
jgi:hypothetical protein